MSGMHRTVQVSETGQLSLPAEMRLALGLKGAGNVLLIEDEGGVRITTTQRSLQQIRDMANAYRPSGGVASEALIADRRAEDLANG